MFRLIQQNTIFTKVIGTFKTLNEAKKEAENLKIENRYNNYFIFSSTK